MTILPFDNNRVFYYEGNNPLTMKPTDYSSLRSIILKKKSATKAGYFFVIIKPGKDASYKNTVDVLDEMSINDVSHYVSSILSGRREITLKMAQRLKDYFYLPAEIFLHTA